MPDRAGIDRRRSRLSPAQQARLARRLGGSIGRVRQEALLEPRPGATPPPLSFAQERLWFLTQLSPDSPVYNRPLTLRIEGPVDPSRLERALRDIVGRHEVLRATFHGGEQGPFQVIHDERLSLETLDLSTQPAESRPSTARAIASQLGRRPFELTRGPLYRAALIRLDDTAHLLALVFHHIVFDAWSAGIVLRELTAWDEDLSDAVAPPLPALPRQYADFAHRQREEVGAGAQDRSLDRMADLLRDAPAALELPTTRRRPSVQTFQGGREAFVIPATLRAALESLGGQEGATLFMVLVAAFGVLLRRYTGEQDLLIGCPVAGRGQPGSEDLIGLFVNTLVLRADLSGDPPFRRLLRRVKDAALEMLEHRDLPFEQLVERLNPPRDPGRTPLFQVVFNLENLPSQPCPGGRFAIEHLGTDVAAFDLELELRLAGDELSGDLVYNRDLFDAAMIRDLAAAYSRLLDAIARDADQTIDRLPLLTPEARRRLLVECNESAVEFPRGLAIPQVVASQAALRPDAPALVSSAGAVSYRELDQRSNQLARHLLGLGVAADGFVALCMPRSVELVVAALATLKAGAAYAPLDPGEPEQRRASMLAGLRPAVVLTRERLDSDRHAIDAQSTGPLSVAPGPEAPAYVIHTSGTTGAPKGVVVPHRAVLSLLVSPRFVSLGESQTHLLLAPFSFDAAVFEVWGALLNGGRCAIAPDRQLTPKELGAIIDEHGVTTLFLTSSLLNVVIDEAPEVLSGLGQLLAGGEALSVGHVRRALALLPTVRIFNVYGPTEAAVFSTSYEPTTLDAAARSVPIGRPVGNRTAYVLDEQLEPVPVGVGGDLYIGGDGLALGYLGAPELTAERFVPDPFAGAGQRMYRSGDLARYLPDGNIELLGRRDRQVKIRGFRIELAEIEAALRTCGGVRDAVAAVRGECAGEKRLVAAVSGQTGSSQVRRELEGKLPGYMIPDAIAVMDSLPRTRSGKADASALPDPVAVWDGGTARPGPEPSSATERALAEIWRDVLARPAIGVRDDFFELGGHSLLAARIFARIERVLGRDIPVATLFRARTIERLAAVLDAAAGAEDWSPLVPISPDGANPPFFCVSPGDVVGLERLAAHLSPRQPFYGLYAHGLAAEPPRPASIEEMASEFIRRIRSVQPRGPYHLGGRCIGGVVAFEMARQLVGAGEEVAIVVVQDTLLAPKLVGVTDAVAARIAELLEGPPPPPHRRALVELRRRLPRRAADLLRTLLDPFRRRPRRAAPAASSAADVEQQRRAERIRVASAAARERYSATPYSGRMALLRAENQDVDQRRQLAWEFATTGPFEVLPLRGNHQQIWQEPWVQHHARCLMACVEPAGARTPAPSAAG